MLPTSYHVNWPLGSEEAKIRFFKMTAITDWNDFSYLLSTSLPDASYQVSSQLAFGSEEKQKKKKKKRKKIKWRPSWIFDRNNFSYF